MKKKVLIIMPSMHIGGAERSLLGMLEAFDKNEYDIDLFLFHQEGELFPLIPKEIHLLNEKKAYQSFDSPIIDDLKSPRFLIGISRILSKIALNRYCKKTGEPGDVWKSMQYTAKFINPFLPKIEGEYDIAISYLGIPFYMSKVKAKRKLAWIHTDYASLLPDEKLDREAFKLVDDIVTVSKDCQKAFLVRYPDLKKKAVVMENILSKQVIEAQSQEEIYDFPKTKELRLLSIGRFCEAKNFDNVPKICSLLLKKNLNVKWYLIGFGTDEELIRRKIAENGMKDIVIILGKKTNPYPYIKQCDFYIQPSRYEGKCVTVREAQLLGKPVIITSYATAQSQLEDGIDGLIVPLENEKCAEGILELIEDKELQKRLVENVKKRDYTNAQEMGKIEEITCQ